LSLNRKGVLGLQAPGKLNQLVHGSGVEAYMHIEETGKRPGASNCAKA